MILAFVIAGCDSKPISGISEESTDEIIPVTVNTSENSGKGSYMNITTKEAKEIMDTETGYIILDVRTPDEFNTGHIENAVLIPDYEISKKAEEVLPDKEQMILVYCRSGRRSASAADKLAKLGYTNVINFGGILDWKYETVK